MKRKVLALGLFAAMLMALVPVASAQTPIHIERTTVFNVSSNSAYSFNPTNTGNGTYHEINAPYDQIATSSPSGFTNGPYYEVTFYLNQELDTVQDTVFVNDKAILLNGTESINGTYRNGMIKVMFTPKRGGNTEVINVKVLDRSTGTTASHSVSVRYIDQYATGGINDPSKNTRDMTVRASGSGSYYTAQISGNTLYIDYNGLYLFEGSYINVNFTFQDQNGVPITQGYVSKMTSYGSVPLVNSFNYDRTGTPARGQITSSGVTLPVTINKSNLTFTMQVETPYDYYGSKTYFIVWRDTGKTTDSSVVTVYPTRYPMMKVGESLTFTVNVSNSTLAGTGFTLDVGGSGGIVDTRTGKALTVKALRTGTTWLNLRNSAGRVLETIYVTVLDNFSTGETTVPTSDTGLYRVTANSLNVRAGAGTGFLRLGSVKRNEQVTVHSVTNSWAKISWGEGYGYVSDAYLTFIGSTTATTSSSSNNDNETAKDVLSGTDYLGYQDSEGGLLGGGGGGGTVHVPPSGVPYVVTAETLNIYSSPGTQFTLLGTLYKGNTVAVVSIDANGWAKIASWGNDIGYVLASGVKPN